MNDPQIVFFIIEWLNTSMSIEKLINTEQQNYTSFTTPIGEEKKISARVDINNLLARVRAEKKKENKINLVFFGLFVALIFIVGIILSF
mgnify:CR=1 FL=1|tara:strand:- start:218 stop:484 length:267 start_codon:yes stop_codon:yes gene_type:complete